MLNLRQLRDSDVQSTEQARTVSTLMFRNNVAGNMGEPLEYRSGDDWHHDSSSSENADEVEMTGRVSSR